MQQLEGYVRAVCKLHEKGYAHCELAPHSVVCCGAQHGWCFWDLDAAVRIGALLGLLRPFAFVLQQSMAERIRLMRLWARASQTMTTISYTQCRHVLFICSCLPYA